MKYLADNGWGRIVLNRPEEKNKFSTRLLRELQAAVDAARDDGSLRALSIESAAHSIFAAGADMNELLDLDASSARGYAMLGQTLMASLESFPIPTFALVAGPCFGGAFDLALSCRHVHVADNAFFCHPGAFLGIMTGFGGTSRLPRRFPAPFARYMLLSGARVDAARAHELGFAQRRYPDHASMLADMPRLIQAGVA